MNVLLSIGGALLQGIASAVVGVFNEWLVKRRIRQSGRMEAELEYERRAREATENLRRNRPATFKHTVDRLREGRF
jgi:hypothetical protein